MKPTPPDPAVPSAAAPSRGFSLKPSKQTAMVLAGMIALSLAGTGGYSFWQNGIREQQAAIITSKTEQVNSGQRIADQLDATEAEYQLVAARIGRLENAVSENDYVPTLLKQLERLAKENDLRVEGQQQSFEAAPEPPTDPEARKKFVPQPYDKEFITLRLQGRYWNLARFMYRLTEFPKILAVDKLEFKPRNGDADKSPVLSITVNLTGYLFKDGEKKLAPEPTPAGIEVPTIPVKAPTLPPRREI